jgi:glycolate oxidase iron-sulfur subunit
MASAMDLGLDDDELSTCVACGLCLPHCPTFRATGEEGLSPRGRIDAMRAVQWRGAETDAEFVHFMETCVQCRGCEPACPSGVPFGRLMEHTRQALANERIITPRWQRIVFSALGHHRLLLTGSTLLALAQRVRLVPARLGLARLAVRRGSRPSDTGTDVWLFTGCVMDAWMREVHADVKRVVEATGAGVALPGHRAACCGALAVHAGLGSRARALARRSMAAFPGDAPILVDAAGCGAMLKDYGHLLGTSDAEAFSARVLDVHEWLAERIHALPEPTTGARPQVAVQDPCHLRHVQRTHLAVRTVLAPYADVVELDDEGLCCGAGGAYAVTQPELASAIRERKLAAIDRAGAPLVASANPGCALHLAAAGVEVVHPCQVVARSLAGG